MRKTYTIPRAGRFGRRALVVTACVGLAAVTAACSAGSSGSSGSSGASSSNDVVFTMPLGAVNADPIDSTNIGTLRVVRAAYDGLVNSVPGTYNVEPALATKWTETGDEVWTFTLRKGVKFTDGTSFNAAAVVANIKRYQTLGGQVGALLDGIKSVTTPNADTVTFTLSAPDSGFIDYLPFAVIVSPAAFTAHAVKGDYAQGWLANNTDGTGPYKSAAPLNGATEELVRNPTYWGGWKTDQIDEIDFLPSASDTTQIEELERGEVDRVQNIPLGPYLSQLKSNSDVSVYEAPGTQIDEIQMNTQYGPLKNLDLRLAVTYAYNYAAAVESAYDGYATVPAGAMPPGFSGFDSAIPRYKQDLTLAKKYLAESGEKNVTLTAWWDSGDDLTYEDAEAVVLQSSLAQIGIAVKLTATTFATMEKAAESPKTAPDFNFLWHGAITADPVEYLGSYFESKYIGGYNWSFFDNKTFDSLLTEASAAPTTAQRNSYLGQAQQLIASQAPALFVAIPEKIEAVNSSYKGFVVGPIDYGYDIDFYALRYEPTS